ncbi:MAG TPA: formate dehydrogenase subunit gamma, partial [Euzebyales bacterium]|nr:formate dehydrogenase subunit gamma [Euzebyales bacterium]
CLHCDEPGCLLACPAPGAIVQYENGIVDFDQDKCIGCKYCIAGCPFDIPRFDEDTKKVYKCTLCVDRVSNGLEPACVKSCPTGSIRFGTKDEMVAYGEEKVAKLADRGFDDAMLYDPEGVGGLHMMYVVPRGDMLAGYDLPEDPQVPGAFFTGMSVLRGMGTASMWAGLLGVGLFFLRTGRRRPPPEEQAVASAYGMAPAVSPAPTQDPPAGGGAAAGTTVSGDRPRRRTPAGTAGGARDATADADIERYSMFDRVLHWFVALTFIYLVLSGLALGYPRMAWLYDVLGGGQTVRWLHPVVGVAMTVAVVVMCVAWVRDMLFDRTDRQWVASLRDYVRDGHTEVDVGRYNAGQKGYFWYAVATTVLLLITGIPLWFPDSFAAGLLRFSRFSHHGVFLLALAGFIVHVYMSTAMFPGTMSAMTTGKVSRRWAAFPPPAWFRRADGPARDAVTTDGAAGDGAAGDGAATIQRHGPDDHGTA